MLGRLLWAAGGYSTPCLRSGTLKLTFCRRIGLEHVRSTLPFQGKIPKDILNRNIYQQPYLPQVQRRAAAQQ